MEHVLRAQDCCATAGQELKQGSVVERGGDDGKRAREVLDGRLFRVDRESRSALRFPLVEEIEASPCVVKLVAA